MVLRITYDVNVWVAHFLSLSKGRQGTAAQRVIRSAFTGHCRLGSVQPIIPHTMLDPIAPCGRLGWGREDHILGYDVRIAAEQLWAELAKVPRFSAWNASGGGRGSRRKSRESILPAPSSTD
jgi:hypothetical protein